jgi:UPF0716 protein FxsA
MPLLLLVLLFAEVALLIELGRSIGGTLLFVELLASAALGFLAIRLAGRSFVRTSEFVSLLNEPGRALRSSGLSLVAAGLLLILPGALSDLAGLFLIGRFLLMRLRGETRRGRGTEPDVIDVEYRVHDDSDR